MGERYGAGILSSFNSIKVRLRLLKEPTATAFAVFQFHKGTIKTTRLMFLTPKLFAVSIP